MSTKEMAVGMIQNLPDDVTLHDIARKIEFIAAVQEGFDSFDREGGVTLEEARARVSAWTKPATK